MMIVLTPEEGEAIRKRQVLQAADAIRRVLVIYPLTDPEALTLLLARCGRDIGVLEAKDLIEARELALTGAGGA